MNSLFYQGILGLAAFLVVLGMGLLLALYYMSRQARCALGMMDELLTLAQRYEDDPLAFVPASLNVLQRSGLGYGKVQMHWFGQEAVFETGQQDQRSRVECEAQVLGSGEIEVRLLLCPRAGLRGEQRVLYTMIQRLWLRLLGSQVNGRLAQLHLSEQQLRRYELFYKHDLKNLAQFMGLLSAQLQHCASEQKAFALVRRLQKLLPSLERRASRILQHLHHKQKEGWDAVEVVSLAEQIRMIAHDMELPVEVEGDARIAVVESAMEQGLQNVLENFRHHLGLGEVRVLIRPAGGHVEILLTSVHMRGGLDEQQRARMFEPFWTTSDSGMGLGLYIARQSFQQACGGTLDAVVMDERTGQWGFQVRCPKMNGVSARSEDSAPPSPDSPAHPPE